MQGGGSEERNRGSRSAMEKGGRDQSAKKPRVDVLPTVPVKQEIVVHQGAGAIVAAERVPTMEIDARMDVPVLHCPLCLLPFRPPVFQCKGGHSACSGCRAGRCGNCEHGAAFDVPSTAMDDVVSSVRVKCLHAGCESYVTYHDASDHQNSSCPHAPCSCTEPGCTFKAPPPALVAHLVAAHAMPHKIPYGKVQVIQVSVPEPAHILLVGAEEESDAFLLTVGALGPVTVVSAVCIRAAACPWPRYTVRMWVNGPPPAEANRRTDTVQTDLEATSSTTPGAVALEDLTSYLMVPPRYLVGDGAAAVPGRRWYRIGKTTS